MLGGSMHNGKGKIHVGYALGSLLCLLLGSYLDSVRGPLLPVISKAMEIPYGRMSFFLVAGNIAAVGMTYSMIPILRRFPERSVAIVSCLGGCVAVGTAFVSTNFLTLMLFALLLGGVISLFSAVSSLFMIHGTSLENRARYFCVLHMMYGFGSLLAPLAVKALMAEELHWNWIVASSLPFLISVGVYCRVFVPFVKPTPETTSLATTKFDLTRVLVLVCFGIYVAGEVLTSMWMVTFLVESQGFTVGQASNYLTIFFLMMALSRGVLFFALPPHLQPKILVGSLVLAMGFFTLGRSGYLWALPLTGIFGPFFPLFMARIGQSFPKETQSMTLWVLTSMQISLGLAHLILGRLTDIFGIATTYWLPLLMMGVAVSTLLFYFRMERERPSEPVLVEV